MTILVTGGIGYIGSHTSLLLLENGYEVVIVDNLSNSREEVLDKIEVLASAHNAKSTQEMRDAEGLEIPFYPLDVRDEDGLDGVFKKHSIDAVIHFAGLKAVGESVEFPEKYVDHNVNGTRTLLKVMERYGVKNMVFSSSATVYGEPEQVPIDEEARLCPTNPYGQTKLKVEELLWEKHVADPQWQVTVLRYFNPVGGHESRQLCENPDGIPNNLMPYIVRVAEGMLPYLNVFGNDYPTKDGTGVRDYIHVMDIAEGHLAALRIVKPGLRIYNLGTGCGYSVLDMVHAFEQANQVKIPYQIMERRPGDIATYYADPAKAERELGWKAKRTLAEMCETSLPMKE